MTIKELEHKIEVLNKGLSNKNIPEHLKANMRKQKAELESQLATEISEHERKEKEAAQKQKEAEEKKAAEAAKKRASVRRQLHSTASGKVSKKIRKKVKQRKIKGAKKLKSRPATGKRKVRPFKLKNLPKKVKSFNKGRSASNIRKDKDRRALPIGKRKSHAGWKNQYGTTKGGKIYYEHRPDRADAIPRIRLEHGGSIQEEREFEYLKLSPAKHGLKISLTKEGKEKVSEDGLTRFNFDDYFEDIRGNSEYMYWPDLGEAGLGLTSADGITDGYYYDDDGTLKEGKGSELYYYGDYAIKDFTEELKNNGEVFFHRAEAMAKGGVVGFRKIQFNSHLTHNPDADILEGHIDNDSFITYGIYVSGPKRGEEFSEYYKGSNYVAGSSKPSFSRYYKKADIPDKYLPLWNELKSKYEKEYSNRTMAKGGPVSSKQWYKSAIEEKAPDNLGGWKKELPAYKRRMLAIRSRDGKLSRHNKYLSAGRALQALANVTKDEETKKVAQADAKYFFRKVDKMAKGGKIKEGEAKVYGRTFKTKVFDSEKEANWFLEKHPEYGVIHENKREGKIHVALIKDEGRKMDSGGIYKSGGKICPVGTEIQSVLFDRSKFTEQQAKDWAEKEGLKYGKVDVKPNTWRLRQENPFKFKKGSFRNIPLTDGAQAVIACPRSEKYEAGGKIKSKVYEVTYTKKIGGNGTVIVKAQNENEALKTAKYSVFTGSDFRDAKQIDDSLYIKPTKQGFQGSQRAN